MSDTCPDVPCVDCQSYVDRAEKAEAERDDLARLLDDSIDAEKRLEAEVERLRAALAEAARRNQFLMAMNPDERTALEAAKWVAEYEARAEQAERERDEAHQWLARLESAAGMGSLAAVADHQRRLGVEGDHETRLREKRVTELADLIVEASAFRSDAATSGDSEAERQARELPEQIAQAIEAVADGWAGGRRAGLQDAARIARDHTTGGEQ